MLTEGTHDRLDSLKKKTGAPNYAEVLRQALLLYEDFVMSPEEGFEYYKRKIDPNNHPVVIKETA